jgi:long-chain acyl-CoA synthetase
LTTNAFSLENDLLTPTFKLKRHEAKKFFLHQIKEIYGGVKLQGEE